MSAKPKGGVHSRPPVEQSQIDEWHPYRLPIGPVGKLRYPELDRRTVLYLLEYLGQTLYGDPERRREVIVALCKLT